MFSVFAATLLLPPAPMPREKPNLVRESVQRALPRLRAGAEGHTDKKTCFACHNQALPMLALATARSHGFTVPRAFFTDQAEHVSNFVLSNEDRFRKGQGTGGQVDTAGYALLTLELAGYKADQATEAVVEYLLKFPGKAAHWRSSSNRPPSEASVFTPTYLALRGLRVWATPAQKERVQALVPRARIWLLKTAAKDCEDRVFRLLAMKEAGASPTELAAAAWELLRTQRSDGGWGQLASLESDAYATGSALFALHEAGSLTCNHPAYQAGLAYLVRTQAADGTWWVKSRSRPFQPYYETGFPYGKNQFISIAATGWATAALALANTPD